MTKKEFKNKLRNLQPYIEELKISDDVIIKTTTGYGIRNVDDFDDPMTDYSAYVYGFKEKWLIERYLNQGILKEV
ncbi:MAG: hypothetical protein V8Q75_03395 [Bacilli bacterium]